MTSPENICSLCMCTYVKFYHLKDSIRAPNDLRFEGHTNLQAVLGKILSKKGEYRNASNEICENCRNKLHGIYSFTHQNTESEKIFHQMTDVTVRLKRLKTFFILTDLKTEFEAIAETDKDVDSPECSSTIADIECDDSVVCKVVVKKEFGNNFEGTDFSKPTIDLSVGLLEGEYSNAADGRNVEQKKVDSIGNGDSELIKIEEEIIKEEWTMQEGEIFEAKAKRDVLGREQTKFSCDVCGEVFATVSCLSDHKKIVHENDSHNLNQADAEHNTEKEEHSQWFDTMKEFACDKCDAKKKSKRSLWAHKMTHFGGATLKCNKSKQAFNEHRQIHKGIIFNCDQFDAKHKSSANLRQHKMSHAGIKFDCSKCNASLSSKGSLKSHLRTVHTDAVFSCEHCDATYKSKQSFSEHRQIHNGILFNCDQCDAKYKTSLGLRLHKISQAGIKFACNQCDASLSSKGCLKNHLRTVHTGAVFSCDQCGDTYKSKKSLNEHKQIHNGILFNCDQCDAKSKTSFGLRLHKMSHAGIKFACNQCDASLPSKRCLKSHLRTVHTDHTDAVFSCDQCSAAYKSKQSLSEHRQIHNGILFNCDQCDVKYKTMTGLRLHKMSHAGIRFACNQCNASLSSKRCLKKHQQRVHTDAIFSCDDCDAIYESKQGLNMHKLYQHPSQENFELT